MVEDTSLDLVALQNRLDHLTPGQQLTIAMRDAERLFGTDDVFASRLSNFAHGHTCKPEIRPSSVSFLKLSHGFVFR